MHSMLPQTDLGAPMYTDCSLLSFSAGSGLLAEAIYSQMSARFEQDLDPMRAFFRTHVSIDFFPSTLRIRS